jgi:para-nitrobenzyl esterase
MSRSACPVLVLCAVCIAGCGDPTPSLGDGPRADAVRPDSLTSDRARPDQARRDAALDGATDRGVSGSVMTSSGPVVGMAGSTCAAFLGVPYAAPPVGAFRFAAPTSHPGWSTPLVATKLGPACPQLASAMSALLPSGNLGSFTTSEDCLTLNIWTPWPIPSSPTAPVMVWVHGGGFSSGGSSLPAIAPSGAALCEAHQAVVVSINYRLGPLGFLAHPILGAASGNYGIQDQQAALKWVQKNIAAFGGDAKRVTLLGESAGAHSVCVHLVSAGSQGLFHRAVMESGACPQAFPINSVVQKRADAEAQAGSLAQAAGCATAADVPTCLRGKSVTDLLQALPLKEDYLATTGGAVTWGPNIDGTTLTDQPLALVKKGSVNKVPVLIGTNADEGSVIVAVAKQTQITAAQYQGVVTQMFSIVSPLVLLSHPASAYSSPAHALSALMGDLAFVCPVRRTARALVAAGVDTYLYQFTVKPSYSTDPFLGVYHSAEVPFVFNVPPPPLTFTAQESTLAKAMGVYWSDFARDGKPGGVWPAYSATADTHLSLAPTIATAQGLRKAQCDALDLLTGS